MSWSPQDILAEIEKVELQSVDGGGKAGWVYFIACHETGRIKIGYTGGNPFKRLKALQTGCSTELALIAMQPGTQETERNLHERFGAHCVRGEWFEAHPALSAYVIDVCWAMSEITLRLGRKLEPWMALGLKYSADRLGALPEGLIELLEAEPA